MSNVGWQRRNEVGSMRHRITVQTATYTVDAARQRVVSYADRLTSEPAAFEQVSGGEAIRGRQVEAGVTAMFRVNYRQGYNETDRVVFDGQNYGIVRIEIPSGIKRYMWLHCKAVV